MIVYIRNKDGNITDVNVERKVTMEGLINKFKKLEGVEKVRLTMVRYSCNCANNFTDVLLEGISKKKKISITVNSDNYSQNSGFTVFAMSLNPRASENQCFMKPGKI